MQYTMRIIDDGLHPFWLLSAAPCLHNEQSMQRPEPDLLARLMCNSAYGSLNFAPLSSYVHHHHAHNLLGPPGADRDASVAYPPSGFVGAGVRTGVSVHAAMASKLLPAPLMTKLIMTIHGFMYQQQTQHVEQTYLADIT